MKKLDDLLNNIAMYRLVVYALSGYLGLGLILTLFGKLSFSSTALIISTALLLGSAYVVNWGFGRLFHVPTNSESWLITALILALIVQPAHTLAGGIALVLAGGVSSASKFILAWNGKHIFNPAALAAALLSLTSIQATTWWVGSSLLWPFTLLVGLAIVYKIRRFPLFIIFAVIGIALQFVLFIIQNQPLGVGMKGALLASPLIFLATIMLTEPATMPPRRNQQLIFGAIVAVLYITAWEIGPFIIYPEVALLIGNLFAFVVSPKFRMRLELKEIQRVSDQVYNYVFRPDRQCNFLPGQYMEWTLAGVPYDSRGNRRTFTIASSPTEPEVQLGLKYYQPSSTYKATFANLQPGDSIFASQLAGNFTLDIQGTAKLAFVAGGIGITPFRSMVRYLIDNNMQRDITLLYVVSDPAELAYEAIFLQAQKIGLRYVPIVTSAAQPVEGVINAKLSEELLTQLLPDLAERTFYISGPNRMVDGVKAYLHHQNVARTQIKTDHFSGY